METLNVYGTAISTLYNCRSDNSNELVNLIDISTGIHSILPHGELIFDTINSKPESQCSTKLIRMENWMFCII